MHELLDALRDPAIPFLRYAFLAGLLSSFAFGIVGSYVVTRRLASIAGAISHCVLGGIGVAIYLDKQAGLTWLHPMLGATAAALLAAIILGLVTLYAREREDTVIGALWAIGMAIGLLFLAKTPGYVDPMSYLFGNILMISKRDLWMILGLDAAVAGLGIVLYNRFLAISFDEEFARLRGVRVEAYYLLLLCMTALTVVLMVSVVGIVMVIALLTLPAAAAGRFSTRMWQMMALAVLFCMTFVGSGLSVSYVYDLPSGPTIIMIGGAVYLLAALAGKLRRKGFRGA
jgi:zinc transport system permease protein